MSPPFIVGLTNSIKQNGWGKSNSSKQNGWGKSSRSTSPKNIRKGIVYETPLSTRKIKIPNLKLFSFAKLKSAAKSNSSKQNGSTKSNGSKSPKNNSWSIVSEISPPSTKERSPRELGKASSNGSKSSKNNSWSIINEISPPSTREKNPRNTDKSIINEISPSSSARIKTPNLKVFTFAGKSIINETSPSSSAGIKTPNLEVFTFAELKSATRNFSPDVVLGEGGFGRVFKGWICKYTYAPGTIGTGMAVAVKKSNPNGRQGLREWQSEIKFLGNLSHPNIIKLLGYCSEDKAYLLVYEFAQKGSLQDQLFRRLETPLPWGTRLKIAIGAARSLAFLHTSEKPIIYRDFKASNIMLDGDYNAKLSDFGLAIFADLNNDSQDMSGPTNGDIEVTTQISWASGDTQVTTRIGTSGSANGDTQVTTHISYSNGSTQVTTHIRRASRVTGTYGYAAPEYVATGRLWVKSDVYSFGVVFLELLTGRRALDRNRPRGEQNLVDWAKPNLCHKRKLMRIMDQRLEDKFPRQGAYKAAQLALNCLHSNPKCRPSMVEVLENLEQINAIKSDNNGAQSQSRARDVPKQRTRVRKSAS